MRIKRAKLKRLVKSGDGSKINSRWLSKVQRILAKGSKKLILAKQLRSRFATSSGAATKASFLVVRDVELQSLDAVDPCTFPIAQIEVVSYLWYLIDALKTRHPRK